MTDKEILELAAKAAGNNIQWDSVEGCWYRETEDYPGNPEWNPLTNDGDALRLAVQLGMSVISGTYKVVCEWFPQEGDGNIITHEQYGNDTYAATRRAIVRAAAEIGKVQP